MSSRVVVRKACGYTLPLWGELKTAGPRHSTGSRISNGRSNSSFASRMDLVRLRTPFALVWRIRRPGRGHFHHHYPGKRAIVHARTGGTLRSWGGVHSI